MLRLALCGALLYRKRLGRKRKYLDYCLRVNLKHDALARSRNCGDHHGEGKHGKLHGFFHCRRIVSNTHHAWQGVKGRNSRGGGRMLLLADPRRIHRIRSLGHSLHRLAAVAQTVAKTQIYIAQAAKRITRKPTTESASGTCEKNTKPKSAVKTTLV